MHNCTYIVEGTIRKKEKVAVDNGFRIFQDTKKFMNLHPGSDPLWGKFIMAKRYYR